LTSPLLSFKRQQQAHHGSAACKAFKAKYLNDYSKEMRKDGVRLDKKPSGLSEGTLSRDKLLYHRTDASVPVGIRQAPIISSKE